MIRTNFIWVVKQIIKLKKPTHVNLLKTHDEQGLVCVDSQRLLICLLYWWRWNSYPAIIFQEQAFFAMSLPFNYTFTYCCMWIIQYPTMIKSTDAKKVCEFVYSCMIIIPLARQHGWGVHLQIVQRKLIASY